MNSRLSTLVRRAIIESIIIQQQFSCPLVGRMRRIAYNRVEWVGDQRGKTASPAPRRPQLLSAFPKAPITCGDCHAASVGICSVAPSSSIDRAHPACSAGAARPELGPGSRQSTPNLQQRRRKAGQSPDQGERHPGARPSDRASRRWFPADPQEGGPPAMQICFYIVLYRQVPQGPAVSLYTQVPFGPAEPQVPFDPADAPTYPQAQARLGRRNQSHRTDVRRQFVALRV